MLPTTIDALAERYRRGDLRPTELARYIGERVATADPAWISTATGEDLRVQARNLEERLTQAGGDLARFPLYGIPFAVKDNIDAAGFDTTAGCPAFAFRPAADATVVARLRAAGALLVGKTNLDQFATGLVGTRSPYGAVPNAFRPEYVSGGSSSGSASVVARGLVCFSLGTDTAGSGRVPAGLNNIVGLKPTRGWLSTRGVLPACRTLDCVSIFALTCADARRVADVAAGFDAADAYSREPGPARPAFAAAPRIGVPRDPEFHGDAAAREAFAAATARAVREGATLVELDFAPLLEAAGLLYQGPWVAERYAAIEAWMREHADTVEPTVRSIIAQATGHGAIDTFKAQYRLAEIRRIADDLWKQVDCFMVPTAPTVHTIAAVNADPVRLNSQLGTYTNFVNLLDMSAIAVPASMRPDGLPFGVTFIAPAWSDAALCEWGARWHAGAGLPLGATGLPLPTATAPTAAAPGWTRVAVVGAHLTGMPLNHELTSRGGVLAAATRTAPVYRLHALAGTVPPKPGLERVGEGGAAIVIELWDLPTARFGEFVAGVPGPLGIGTLEVEDGSLVKGFICEPWALADAQDITAFGGWRAYMASRA